MIRINLIGAMGNQLFEYAYARAISEEFNDGLILINPYFTKFYNTIVAKSFKMTENSLKFLSLNERVKEIDMIPGMLLSFFDFMKYCFESLRFVRPISKIRYLQRSSKGNFRLCKYGFTYFEHSEQCGKKKVFSGLYQCEKFFGNIKSILLDELQVKTLISEENAKMIKELNSSNSVCVHIRKGDYDDPEWKFLKVCNEKYYQDGMDYITAHTENPVFYIFSNTHRDLEWIKENYHFTYPVKYVDLGNPAHEDFRLMYNCKHFVISNSTFSWWGSYMSQNPSKIVVAPDIWQRKEYNGSMDIYRDDMVKIHVDLEESV